MTAEHAALWQRISTFPLDAEGATNPYSAKLGRENRWAPAYAKRVIEEYRRFAFLAVAAGHPVSPSDAVDQAWHMHLFYTQNYWGEFCKEALGKPLHHNPSQGRKQTNKFDDDYQLTLASYERLFGEAPPPDIWPSPEVKQSQRRDYIRVDRSAHWVIPKLPLRKVRAALAVTAVSLVLFGCAEDGLAPNPFHLDGPGFLAFYGALMASALILAIVAREIGKMPRSNGPESKEPLTPLETACLAGGEAASLNSTIGALVMCGYLKVNPVAKTVEATGLDTAGLDPLAAHIVEDCSQLGGRPLRRLKTSTEVSMQAIQGRLVQKQLLLGGGDRLRIALFTALIAAAPLLLGIPRLYFGVMAGHPIGYLVTMCLATAIVAIAFFLNSPTRTRRGDNALRIERQTKGYIRGGVLSQPTIPDATLAIALYGYAVLPATMRSEMAALYLTTTYTGSSCSSSSCSTASSCGSSGGASSCGGGGSSGCGGGSSCGSGCGG